MFHGKLVDRAKTAQKPDWRHEVLPGDRDVPEDGPGPDRIVQSREDWQAILDALEPEVRLLARLRFEEGLSWKEIVKQIGVAESACRMRLARGLLDLRARWEQRDRDRGWEVQHVQTGGDQP
jgi:DNA-directed RNA polymerase specialized sigma24 family protein